jgi:hypothetical protein
MPDPTTVAAAPETAAAPVATPAADPPRLVGRDALALFEDGPAVPATTPKAEPAPAVPAAAPATDAAPAPAAEPVAKDPPPTEQTPAQRKAFLALANEQAKLRREQQAFAAQQAEAQRVLEWYRRAKEDPQALADEFGADVFERGARAAAGAPPKEPDPNARVAALEARLEQERQAAEQTANQQRVQQGLAQTQALLSEANKDGRFDTILARGSAVVREVYDAVAIYCHERKYQIQTKKQALELITAIGDRLEKEHADEVAGIVEKVPKLRSRFAPAPAAPTVAATPAAPPKDPAPQAREATAPATLTSRHGNDAAPSVSNGRRKPVSEVDDEVAARFWG